MSTDYPVGTVAKVRPLNADSWTRAIRHRNGEWASAQFGHFLDEELADVQPLVVLDIDSLDTMAPDEGETAAQYVVRTLRGPSHGLATRRAIADQIEAQTKPSRLPEPGLWGVVEGREGNRWVRVTDDDSLAWQHLGSVTRDSSWSYICETYAPITLIREGVES